LEEMRRRRHAGSSGAPPSVADRHLSSESRKNLSIKNQAFVTQVLSQKLRPGLP